MPGGATRRRPEDEKPFYRLYRHPGRPKSRAGTQGRMHCPPSWVPATRRSGRDESCSGVKGVSERSWPVMSIAEAHARLTAPGERLEIEEIPIRGIMTRVWKNAPPTLRDVFLNARGFPDREFLVYDDERATYEAFARATVTLARQLQADGVRKGDRVAVI